MTTLTAQFNQQLSQLLTQCQQSDNTPPIRPAGLAIGFSGGVDSCVLLALSVQFAKQHQLPLCAIYVDHGLSPNAQQWQQFCKQRCEALNVAFFSQSVRLVNKPRTSLEAQAREARYGVFEQLAPRGYALLLGQHVDDQVETFFLRLKRGAGLKGLGAMKAYSQLDSGRVVLRPLLAISRQAIETYAREQQISHIEDESNQDNRFDRNFLRNKTLPILTQRFEGFNQRVYESALLLQQQQQLIDEIAKEDHRQATNEQGGLSCVALAGFSAIRAANLLRYWLERHHLLMPAKTQLDELLRQALQAKNDAKLSFCLGKVQVKRYQHFLYVVTPSVQPNTQQLTHWQTQEITLQDGGVLSCVKGQGVRAPKDDETVTVRFGQLSARIKPPNKVGSNTLKHWLKDAKIPPWQRTQIPLIFYNEQLVQVVGYFYEHNLQQTQGIQWQITKNNRA